MARDSSGPKDEPQYSNSGTPSDGSDLSEIATYAALVGNRKSLPATTRTGLTGSDVWEGLEVHDQTDKGRYEYINAGWVRRQLIRLGRNELPAPLVITGAATWTDVCSVAVTSTGGLSIADWRAFASNGNSGARQIALYRVLLDGAVVGPASISSDLPLVAGAGSQYSATYEHEASTAAGSHTWKLQIQCSVANAISVSNAVLIINEI